MRKPFREWGPSDLLSAIILVALAFGILLGAAYLVIRHQQEEATRHYLDTNFGD